MSERRIYVLVADTVQSHLQVSSDFLYAEHRIVIPTWETKTIIQPKGRIAAQVGHVVSRMRMFRMAGMNASWWRGVGNADGGSLSQWMNLELEPQVAYTTIILGVPDSFALRFRRDLLERQKLHIHAFYDTNDAEYGEGQEICTAICTEPIQPEEAGGALDYLKLWK